MSSGIDMVSGSMAAASQNDAVSIAVLRKALDVQQQSAAQLIDALPQQPRPSAGSGSLEQLGRNIDVTA